MTKRLIKFVAFRGPLILILFGHVCAAALWCSDVSRKPRVRAITAFVSIDRATYGKQIQDTLAMLRKAKSAFEKGGYEVQTIRITTQPFPQYTRGTGTTLLTSVKSATRGWHARPSGLPPTRRQSCSC